MQLIRYKLVIKSYLLSKLSKRYKPGNTGGRCEAPSSFLLLYTARYKNGRFLTFEEENIKRHVMERLEKLNHRRGINVPRRGFIVPRRGINVHRRGMN